MNKAAEFGLSSQLDEVGNLDVNIKTAPLKLTLENVTYGEGEEISPALTKALIAQTSEILDSSNFDLEGMSLRVQQLVVDTGKLTLQAEADVEKIPFAEN